MLVYVLLLLVVLGVFAQQPENYPSTDQGPPEITFVNVLIYFLFPVLIVTAYIWTRSSSHKKRIRRQRGKNGD